MKNYTAKRLAAMTEKENSSREEADKLKKLTALKRTEVVHFHIS